MKKKAYAKVNIFLKIVGKKDGYHLLNSRFMLVKNLYDEIEFKPKEKGTEFVLEGKFGCKTEQNSIYKIYQELKRFKKVEEFFQTHKVVVQKNIPEFAGLGGGSSDSAAFLNLCNEVLGLNLSIDERVRIGKKVGSDVAFFIYEYDSANVSGFGEIVKRYDEEPLFIKTFTPPIKCSTPKVYQKFSSDFLKFETDFAKNLMETNSKEILQNYKKEQLNDLFEPALLLCPKLKEYIKPHHFFSGSGSSLFWIEE